MTEPVQFSETGEQQSPPQPPPSPSPAEQPAVTDAASRRRGRPRSQETIKRDDEVARVLAERGPLTRADVAAELNLPSSLVYLSLWRLRNDGRVERGSVGDVRHAWRVVPSA